MRNFYLLIISFLFSSLCASQIKKIDSIEQLLKKNSTPKERVKINLNLSRKAYISEPKKSRIYSLRALNIAKDNNFSKDKAIAYSYIAVSFLYSEKYEIALKYIDSSLTIAKKLDDKTLIADNYNVSATCYSYKNDYYKSFQLYDKALENYRIVKKNTPIGKTLINISILFHQIKDYEKAIEYAFEAQKNTQNDDFSLAYTNQQIGFYYIEKNDLNKAKIYTTKSIKLFEKTDKKLYIYYSYLDLAKIYFKEDNLKKAKTIFKDVVLNAKNIKSETLQMKALFHYSELLCEQKKYKEAIVNLNTAYKIASNLKQNEDIFKISKLLATANTKISNYKVALKYANINNRFKDSINKSSFFKGEFEHDLKELGLKKEKEIETLNLKKQQQHTIFYIIIFFTIFTTLLFSYLYKKRTKQKELISKQKEIIENSLTENKILLSELQHRVKNNLQMMRSLLNRQLNSITDNKQKEIFQYSINRINIISKVYDKLYKNNSANITTMQLKEYLEDIINELSTIYNSIYDIDFKLNVDPQIILNIDQIKSLGLIINELITNSFKHAFKDQKNNKINISINKNNDNLVFNYLDNGVGLTTIKEKTGSTKSLGFNLILRLLKQIHNAKVIETDSSNGMSFSFSFKNKI